MNLKLLSATLIGAALVVFTWMSSIGQGRDRSDLTPVSTRFHRVRGSLLSRPPRFRLCSRPLRRRPCGGRDGGSTRPPENVRVKPAVNVVHPDATARRTVDDRHERPHAFDSGIT